MVGEEVTQAELKAYLESLKEARKALRTVMSGTEKAEYIVGRLCEGHYTVIKQEGNEFWVDIELQAEKVRQLRIYHQSFTRTLPLPLMFARLHKTRGGPPLVRAKISKVFIFQVKKYLGEELANKVSQIYSQLLAETAKTS